jgi:hypothetical protein
VPIVATAAEALDLIEREGVVTLVPVGDRPSLIAAIVGGPIRGSWWGHPQGKLIFDIATALEASREVLVTKLVDGKLTFVYKTRWSALYRYVTDPSRVVGIGRAAANLLARVERAGTLRPTARDAAARKVLEQRALVHATSEHTDKGHHAAVLTAWSAWAAVDTIGNAGALSFDDARAALGFVDPPPAPARSKTTKRARKSARR